ncbi:hypothetical protein KDE12_05945 [Campylobacter sp. faydin G-105]|nr:hypothetical protein [Campylobacter anatolicus]MBR8462395.1 hypothetical protein [Campylobacter anatolicus]
MSSLMLSYQYGSQSVAQVDCLIKQNVYIANQTNAITSEVDEMAKDITT